MAANNGVKEITGTSADTPVDVVIEAGFPIGKVEVFVQAVDDSWTKIEKMMNQVAANAYVTDADGVALSTGTLLTIASDKFSCTLKVAAQAAGKDYRVVMFEGMDNQD